MGRAAAVRSSAGVIWFDHCVRMPSFPLGSLTRARRDLAVVFLLAVGRRAAIGLIFGQGGAWLLSIGQRLDASLPHLPLSTVVSTRRLFSEL